MVLAVLPRRLNLEVRQWITIGAIASVGIALAVWVLFATPTTSAQPDSSVSSPNAIEQTGSEATSPATGASSEAPNLPDQNEANHAPAWAVTLQDTLSPLSKPVNFFYIVGDVFLLIIASTLLLAFWGGRFAQSWRMIAAATFSLYIADMWFKYEDAVEPSYHSGSLLEVFFVFSGVLFAIGAALEYDVSSRSRRSTRKRA
jgi:hypothetical protein